MYIFIIFKNNKMLSLINFKINDKDKNNIVYSDDRQCLLVCTLDYLKEKSILNWSKNRPPDVSRINEISKYYIKNNIKLVPGIVYIWEYNDNYIIYDGIHRFLASLENNISMNYIVSITKTENEQKIIDEFININKSICVPSIYLENSDCIKKMICQNITENLCKKYPKFVSPSRNPFTYNFNRDNIIEFISTLDIDFNNPDIEKIVMNELKLVNLQAKDFVINKGIKTPRKCEFYNFYLFYLDKPIIKLKIENGVKKYLNTYNR